MQSCNAFLASSAIFKGDTAQIVRLMLVIIEKFKTQKGKQAALESAAAAQVVDINPDAGFLRVMLRQREKEKTELDLKSKMVRAKEEKAEQEKAAAAAAAAEAEAAAEKKAEEARAATEAATKAAAEAKTAEAAKLEIAVPKIPTLSVTEESPRITLLPKTPRRSDVPQKSTSFLVRALSVLRKESEKVRDVPARSVVQSALTFTISVFRSTNPSKICLLMIWTCRIC